MYCSECECEFEGWKGRCPQCKNPLIDVKPAAEISTAEVVAYPDLLKLILEEGGELEVILSAVKVSKSRARRFPWLGYGFAWTSKMKADKDGLSIEFNTTKIEKKQNWRFPYQGLGYAWREEMQGQIGGNKTALTAEHVTRERRWRFPYSGYGYAWTDVMNGKCGPDINVEFKSTHVERISRSMFPYFGFGYAWVREGVLTLSLAD
jgi:hypothetical protein